VTLNLKPNHKAIKDYYDALSNLDTLRASHEGAVSPAFAALLRHCARQFDWTLLEQHSVKRNGHPIRVDGALVDTFKLPHGYWEAKDSTDDLGKEVKKKFAAAGARLADLHVNYEKQPEYPLQRLENKDEPLNWRVEKMKLSKDKTQLVYNDFLILGGIPPEIFDYRLGNRSALDWIVDQYQVSTDKRSGIVNDPNRADDPEYIVRLIGQVSTVSLETVKIVKGLPPLA